ncbi:MAG: hypothetical protein J6A33_05270 [Alphaproteobacteria bacterium]|nr:hypothetical protein [Alphaproteobacteria bacterium]
MATGKTYNCGKDLNNPEAYKAYEAAFAKMNEGLSPATLKMMQGIERK